MVHNISYLVFYIAAQRINKYVILWMHHKLEWKMGNFDGTTSKQVEKYLKKYGSKDYLNIRHFVYEILSMVFVFIGM